FRKEEVLVRVQTHLEKARLTRALQEKNRALEEEIARRLQATSERNHLAEQLSHISRRETERWGVAGFVARSQTMQQMFYEVDLLQSANSTAALIVGESGTGKELVARAIHFGGPGVEAPFIPVNCAAIPANLAESQFFGHVKGAFTGAEEDRIGYFGLADGGTLFLDEVGEMPVEIQPKLLRALEDGRIVPVGGKEERGVEVRTIAATNADLQASMAEGTFRRDLYYRLARFTLQVPPLRQRREDIP
ncbi:MAG: sigma-54 factor interaction domain-containing protein, partial [Victivallales bacterium]|nr:sigma-54 factor interaction domain-containing protein [Victivallales bacterium]